MQRALFHEKLAWNNNPLDYFPVANSVQKLGQIALPPGWVAPGNQYRLADPVENGWEKVAEVIELFPEAEVIPLRREA